MSDDSPSSGTALDERLRDATATPGSEAETILCEAEILWNATVRAAGRAHVTPPVAVRLDGRLFGTGGGEQTGRNVPRTASCTLTTGCHGMSDGLDVVAEGEAAAVRDDERLRDDAAACVAQYGG